MKTFITIKDGRIDDIRQQNQSPGKNWIEVPIFSDVSHGVKVDWYDENWRRFSNNELVAQGKRIDNRGYWYNKETRADIYIGFLDEEIDKTLFTREKPIENEPFQQWDEQENKWVVDTEKKERAEKESKLAKVQMEIEDTEKKMIRSMRAIMKNRATENDTNKFDEYDTLIEEELRPERDRLERELKIA